MAKDQKKYMFTASLVLGLIAGIATYIVDLRMRTNQSLQDLDSRVTFDLELRAHRLREYFVAKKTDLALFSESKEVLHYIDAFEKIKNPDYQTVREHFNGTRKNDNDDFVKLYSDIQNWAKACTDYFGFHNIMIVNPAGEVIFSFTRGPAFGTNLLTGPFANRELGTTFKVSMERRGFYASDFAHMSGVDSLIAAYMGITVVEGERLSGALVLQVPTDQIQMEIGSSGILKYQSLVLHSDKVRHAFHGFDSLQRGELLEKSVNISYFTRQAQVLSSYYNPELNMTINTTYPLIKGLIAFHSTLLLGLLIFRLYLRYKRVPISATNSIMVQSTWASIIDNPEKIGKDFYINLFNVPVLADVFKKVGHHPDLYKKLVSMMSLIVNNSDRLHIIEAEIQKLAGMHNRLGVRPEHMQPFIHAFIKTVEQQYDGEFNSKLRQAWLNVLNEIGKIFLENLKISHQESHQSKE